MVKTTSPWIPMEKAERFKIENRLCPKGCMQAYRRNQSPYSPEFKRPSRPCENNADIVGALNVLAPGRPPVNARLKDMAAMASR
jgi:hypothetical protein